MMMMRTTAATLLLLLFVSEQQHVAGFVIAPQSTSSHCSRLTEKVGCRVTFNFGRYQLESIVHSPPVTLTHHFLLCLAMTQFATPSSAADLYFQLEEMEDVDKCVTALDLNPDGTVSFGETDGPRVSGATGTWEQSSGDFAMWIQRTYEAGHEKRLITDVGEFHYSTERILTGELCRVGASLAFKGIIHIQHEVFLGDEEVGYFSMIDTTEERTELAEVSELLNRTSCLLNDSAASYN